MLFIVGDGRVRDEPRSLARLLEEGMDMQGNNNGRVGLWLGSNCCFWSTKGKVYTYNALNISFLAP